MSEVRKEIELLMPEKSKPHESGTSWNQAISACTDAVVERAVGVDHIKNAYCYDFPKGYSNAEINAYQRGVINVCNALSGKKFLIIRKDK